MSLEPVLAVKDLHVGFQTDGGMVHAVQAASWSVRRGETLGIVGESGSGKTASVLAVMDLLPGNGGILGGEIEWMGEPVTIPALRRLRGSRMAMIFQDPMRSLDPLMSVGRQIAEVLRKHNGMGRADAKARAIELLALVGVSDPARRARQYPFEFSGGMAQRAMIASALAAEPELLIADEPTTALDVTIQAQILDVIASLQQRLGISMLLITHDLGVIANVADRVAVMYAGRVVEEGETRTLFAHPRHPYTEALIAATPDPRRAAETLVPIPGSPPTVTEVTQACSFASRCRYATGQCQSERPELQRLTHDPAHDVACWHAR